MIHDQALMIHYEKQEQAMRAEICKFIVL